MHDALEGTVPKEGTGTWKLVPVPGAQQLISKAPVLLLRVA